MLRPANLKNSDWKFHSTNQQWRGDAKAKVTSSGWSMLWSVSIWSQPLQKQHSSTSWSSSEVKSDLITKILWKTAEKTWVMDETQLEVLIFCQALLKGRCDEVFKQFIWTNFFQKHVPCVQFTREVLEFTVQLKYKVRSLLLPNRGNPCHGKQLLSWNPRLLLDVL